MIPAIDATYNLGLPSFRFLKGYYSSTVEAGDPIQGSHLTTKSYIETNFEPVLTAGTSSQYYRGDKTWQELVPAAIGLGNVDDIQQLPLSYLDTDVLLFANSDTRVPSQKALKTYIDSAVLSESLWNDNGASLTQQTANRPVDLGSGNLTTTGAVNLSGTGTGKLNIKTALNGLGVAIYNSNGDLQFQLKENSLVIRAIFGGGSTYYIEKGIGNVLQTDANFYSSVGFNTDAASSSNAYTCGVSGDSSARWYVAHNGIMNWGDGGGATDTNLYRSGANALKTDDTFTATTITGAEFQSTRAGTITRDASNYITQVALTGGSTTVVTRNGTTNLISSFTRGGKTYTITRTSNYITSWTVA